MAKRKTSKTAFDVKAYRAKAWADLLEAKDADSILNALARGLWAKTTGAECPADRIPTEAAILDTWEGLQIDLAALRKLYPEARSVEWDQPYTQHTMNLDTKEIVDVNHYKPDRVQVYAWLPDRNHARDSKEGAGIRNENGHVFRYRLIPLADVHEDWKALDGSDRGKHPAADLVRAWQALPKDAKPDTRRRAILPDSLRGAGISIQVPDRRKDGFLFDVGAFDVGPVLAPVEQGHLPFLETEGQRGNVVPVLPLQIYDGAGGPLQTQGRKGAPIPLRLFYQALTSVNIQDRGHARRLYFRLRDLVSWIWPMVDPKTGALVLDRYGNQRTTWQKNRDLLRLQYGLWELDNLRMKWRGGLWRPVSVTNMPDAETDVDERLPFFDVSHVPGSGQGPLIDRHKLQVFGKESAVAFRAYIGLAYLWDSVKAKAGGRRIYATIPKVRTGRGGALLDAQGRPILDTETGKPVTDWSDRRAVPVLDAQGRQVLTRNPAADRIPWCGPEDQAELGYGKTTGDRQQVAKRAAATRRALTQHIEAAGVLVIETDTRTGAIRLIEPAPDNAQGGRHADR